MTPPRARRLSDATLPLNVMASEEGFLTVYDAEGWIVLSLHPNRVAAIARAVAVATEPPPWPGQPIPRKAS